MNDQERKMEILKAEEVIRQLAGELAQASKNAALAESARLGLEEARNTINQLTAALTEAAKTVSTSGEHSSQLLKSTSEETLKTLSKLGEELSELLHSTSQETIKTLSEISKQIDVATDRLQAAAQSIEDNPKISRLISFNRWLMILVGVAIGGVVSNIIIMLIKR